MLALLLVIVCIAISSIVIVAAATSFGHLTDQGKSDKRYYSVTSAASLFRDSLDSNGELTVTLEQEETTYSDGSPGSTTQSITSEPSTGGYGFLEGLTCKALYDKTPSEFKDSATTVSEKRELGKLNPSEVYEYTITPSDDEVMTVIAKAQMTSEWMLELVFWNPSTSDDSSADSFKLYMSFMGDYDVDISTTVTQKNGGKDAEGNTILIDGEKKKTTATVTWSLDRIEPGRGL